MTTLYLRANLTEPQLAVLSRKPEAGGPLLHDLMAPLGDMVGAAPTNQRELWIVDGTMTATRDGTRTAPCTSYRRSTNVQAVTHHQKLIGDGG